MRYFLLALAFFSFSVCPVFAQIDTDAFSIRVTVGEEDAGPPTVPVLLSAIPSTYNQIDLTWSSSTDDYGVGGYNVLRDGVAIATTTLFSYSDTDLSASTTYSYTIRAFDIFRKYSSSSNSLSTTTLPEPPPPPSIIYPEGTIARVVLDDLFVDTGISTTSLGITTGQMARLEVRWGRTSSYELGYIVEGVYKREHSFLLTDLEPGTKYQYEVIGYTPHGNSFVLKEDSFTTEIEKVYLPPSNVRFFSALRNGDDVDLSWEMPPNTEVMHVRIVRSHLGFPEYPSDGAIAYQGLKTSFVDTDILSRFSPVYYTAFVYDANGNVSSGAVAIVYGLSEVSYTEEDKNEIIGSLVITDEATTTTNQERVTPDMKMPQANDISITQGENTFTFADAPVYLISTLPFTVSLPKDSVAGNLKSIIVTIVNPTDTRENYSFLLRINKDQTAYEAVISSFSVLGKSQIRLEIYDYEVFVVAKYQTPVEFVAPDEDTFFFGMPLEQLIFDYFIGFLLLIIIFLITLMIRRHLYEDK